MLLDKLVHVKILLDKNGYVACTLCLFWECQPLTIPRCYRGSTVLIVRLFKNPFYVLLDIDYNFEYN